MKRVLLLASVAVLGWAAAPGGWDVTSDQMTNDGHIYHLRGHAELKSADLALRADTIDYDEDKAAVHLAGNVTIESKIKGTLRADEADYDVHSGEVRLKASLKP